MKVWSEQRVPKYRKYLRCEVLLCVCQVVIRTFQREVQSRSDFAVWNLRLVPSIVWRFRCTSLLGAGVLTFSPFGKSQRSVRLLSVSTWRIS